MSHKLKRDRTAVLEKSLALIASAALIAMMVHVVAHGLSRHAFNAPFYGTNEIVAYWYMPVLALCGLLAAQIRGEHISVTILVDSLSDRTRRAMLVVGRALGCVVSIGFAWFGLQEALNKFEMGTTAGITTIPMWPVTFFVPVVFLALALLYVVTPIAARAQSVEDPSTDSGHIGSAHLID